MKHQLEDALVLEWGEAGTSPYLHWVYTHSYAAGTGIALKKTLLLRIVIAQLGAGQWGALALYLSPTAGITTPLELLLRRSFTPWEALAPSFDEVWQQMHRQMIPPDYRRSFARATATLPPSGARGRAP